MSTIKNRLKALRNEKGLTQDELVSELNNKLGDSKKAISKMTISNWENNKHSIKQDKAELLADFFGVSVSYLLGYEDPKAEYIVYEDQLAKLRKTKGITQEELASSLNFPLSLVKDWEAEKRGYTKEQLQILGDFFEISPSEVLGIHVTNFDPLDDKNNENELTSIYRNLTDYNKERLMIYAKDLKALEDFNKANNT